MHSAAFAKILCARFEFNILNNGRIYNEDYTMEKQQFHSYLLSSKTKARLHSEIIVKTHGVNYTNIRLRDKPTSTEASDCCAVTGKLAGNIEGLFHACFVFVPFLTNLQEVFSFLKAYGSVLK